METILRKYGWAFTLGAISLSALLLALSVNNVISSQLAPFTVADLPRGPQPGERPDAVDRRSKQPSWTNVIAKRCLFGCVEPEVAPSCPEGCEDDEECQNGTCVAIEFDEAEILSDTPVLSDLNMKLMGCMVANDPRWSMALLFDNSTQGTHVARTGDFLPEGAEILEVRRDRVILSRNGRLEFIKMENSIGGNPVATRTAVTGGSPSAAATRGARSVAAPRPTTSPRQEAVRKQNDNLYQISRSAIEQELSDPAALARQARIIPNYQDGEAAGLKLVGIAPNSVYSQLGIRSGDVIHSVNGQQLDNQRKAMELLESMRREKQVVIEVERHGKREKVQYDID